MEDRIAKERLNVILLVDTSKSMQGERISQVNHAIRDIRDYLVDLQDENTNVDFYLSIIEFSNDARYYENQTMINVKELKFKDITCGGWSNLHCAYESLGEILKKTSRGGIMPDFGGVAPILLLLTDGHPTTEAYKQELDKIKDVPWFKVALRYGIAIELDDQRTKNVLKDFVGDNGDVITCFNASMLKNIIKIIVLTASKVKSTNTNASYTPIAAQNQQAKQLIAEALSDADLAEW